MKRTTLRLIGRLFSAALLLSCVAFTLPSQAAESPNVLFIGVDDLRPEIACYDVQKMITPNLDRLAELGVRSFRPPLEDCVDDRVDHEAAGIRRGHEPRDQQHRDQHRDRIDQPAVAEACDGCEHAGGDTSGTPTVARNCTITRSISTNGTTSQTVRITRM